MLFVQSLLKQICWEFDPNCWKVIFFFFVIINDSIRSVHKWGKKCCCFRRHQKTTPHFCVFSSGFDFSPLYIFSSQRKDPKLDLFICRKRVAKVCKIYLGPKHWSLFLPYWGQKVNKCFCFQFTIISVGGLSSSSEVNSEDLNNHFNPSNAQAGCENCCFSLL